MTDNEIIKYMQCVIGNEVNCSECEYQKALPFPSCRRMCAKNALDLITRQQAEIERLKECPKCVYEYDGEVMEYCVQGACPNFKTVEQIKSEAVKEFAERLKEKSFQSFGNYGITRDVVEVCDIDNLIKEMTEVNENE